MTRRRNAFSRIDLLAVLVLALLGGGIAIPAVRKARTADARATCADNLRRMGAAIHQYATDNGGLLPQNNPDDSPAETRGSHVTRVLPYLGFESVARSYRWDVDWAHPDNSGAVKTRLPFLHCPVAPRPERTMSGVRPDDVGGAKFTAAPSDYVAVTGLTNALVPAVFSADFDRSGVMPTGAPRRIDDIPDGASTTLIVVEIADKPNHWKAGKLVDVPDTNEFGYGAWASPANVNNPRGYSWDGDGFPGPCPLNCSNLYAVYSFHPEGANTLFADGSVRLLKQSVDIWVFYALITSRGGEILAPGDF